MKFGIEPPMESGNGVFGSGYGRCGPGPVKLLRVLFVPVDGEANILYAFAGMLSISYFCPLFRQAGNAEPKTGMRA